MPALLDAYLDLLKRKPMLTKSVTSSVLAALGRENGEKKKNIERIKIK